MVILRHHFHFYNVLQFDYNLLILLNIFLCVIKHLLQPRIIIIVPFRNRFQPIPLHGSEPLREVILLEVNDTLVLIFTASQCNSTLLVSGADCRGKWGSDLVEKGFQIRSLRIVKDYLVDVKGKGFSYLALLTVH